MWKKGESEEVGMPATVEPGSVAGEKKRVRETSGAREAATIGPSINIKGDVTGDEDLMIQGRIEGTVTLKQHNVVVGPEGQVKASIHGRSVTVEGTVVGDLRGDEQVVLRTSASVEGNIQAPRVTLEDGASFKGGIDMGDTARPQTKPGPAKVSTPLDDKLDLKTSTQVGPQST